MRSRTVRRPPSCWRFTRSGPPSASAKASRRRSSSISGFQSMRGDGSMVATGVNAMRKIFAVVLMAGLVGTAAIPADAGGRHGGGRHGGFHHGGFHHGGRHHHGFHHRGHHHHGFHHRGGRAFVGFGFYGGFPAYGYPYYGY